MSFATTTDQYDDWLASRLTIDPAELVEKSRKMRVSEHAFLRGTFYRWSHLWMKHCAKLDRAPQILGVGDIHVENFGTWRDADGRLAWGVNDFDEACMIPYTADLTRLATSALLAEAETARSKRDKVDPETIIAAILRGYRSGLDSTEPFVLAEHHEWLRKLVGAGFEVEDSDGKTRYRRFVDQMESLPSPTGIPPLVGEILRDSFPKPTPNYTLGHRLAGLGSLGRQRFTGVARDWYGGMIVREVKALTTSAWLWARGDEATTIHYNRIIKAAHRSPDPSLQVRGGWVVRRLAPDVGKIEIADLPPDAGEDLLHAMGRELANVHCPSGETLKDIRGDLDRRPDDWLLEAAIAMRDYTHKDWEELKQGS